MHLVTCVQSKHGHTLYPRLITVVLLNPRIHRFHCPWFK